jgi:hypothetical protein
MVIRVARKICMPLWLARWRKTRKNLKMLTGRASEKREKTNMAVEELVGKF